MACLQAPRQFRDVIGLFGFPAQCQQPLADFPEDIFGPPSLKLWRISNLDTEVPFCEGLAGTAFQISLKLLSQFWAFDCRVELDLPRAIFGSMRSSAGVVIVQSLLKIRRVPPIKLGGIGGALENVGVEHSIGDPEDWGVACNP